MAHPAWTDEFLDSMRLIGDNPADQLVQELFVRQDVGQVNSIMLNLVENEGIPPGSIPDSLSGFLQSEAILPQWADRETIKAGEQLFWLHGPAIVLILFCYSLPYCYAARKEVQALARTGRLSNNPNRRVTETAQMLIDVMAPGGLTGSGAGVRTAQKVRLMHAGVRYLIRTSAEWNPEFDCPLNQEDLAGTLMSFAWIGLDGLRKLNIDVSEADAEAYLHCWKVVGHILGVQEALLPVDLADAKDFTAAFERRQFAECPEGKDMTEKLLLLMEYILPGDIFKFIPRAFTYYFVGEKTANLLGVKEVPFNRELLLPLRASNLIADDFLDSSTGIQKLAEMISRHLLESLQFVARGGNRPSFSIPTQLWEGWKERDPRINLGLFVRKATSDLLQVFRHPV